MEETVSLQEARHRVLGCSVARLPSEAVALSECLGRHLARDVHADTPWPTADRSAMDGFGLSAGAEGAGAGRVFRVVGAALAGHPFAGVVGPGEAVRIMTGGVVPSGVDTVVRVEDTGGFETGDVTVRTAVPRGANIRRTGSEIEAGELLLRAGQRLRAAEIGALAVLGRRQVDVVRRPRVAILSTGDEVVPIERTPEAHQVRDSNSWALAAQAAESGAEAMRLGIAPDDAASLEREIARALSRADVLVTIGGVSMGTHDLVHGTLERLGVATVFHGVAVKPGKPAYFGRVERDGASRFVFGLPGNPASCTTVFDLLVVPLLSRLVGADAPQWLTARLIGPAFRRNSRLQAIPARFSTGPEATLTAELVPGRPSGDPFGLLAGDGYALIPADAGPEHTQLAQAAFYSSGWKAPRA